MNVKSSITSVWIRNSGILLGILLSFLLAVFLYISVITGFTIWLNKWNIFKELQGVFDSNVRIGLTAFVLFFSIKSWDWLRNFWEKYRNTYAVTKSKLTYVDFVFLTFYFIFLVPLFERYFHIQLAYDTKFFLFTTLTILIGYIISSFYWRKTDKKEELLSGISYDDISDEPINYLDQDLLKRDKFIGGLSNEIKNLKSRDSFVFGLYGQWGEGKSSVINLLRKLFQYSHDFIVINFEPWYFKDDDAILNAFFKSVETSLSKNYIFPKLKAIFYKYQELVVSGLTSVGIKISFRVDEETIDDVKYRIEKYIQMTRKKLLIIIDEIDRLEKDEIRMILKVVRSNSRFKDTVFLLSMDYAKVCALLGDQGALLEKVVQKPIFLPKIDHSLIDNYFLYSKHDIPRYRLRDLPKIPGGTEVTVSGAISKLEKGNVTIREVADDGSMSEVRIRYQGEISSDFVVGVNLFVRGLWNGTSITLAQPGFVVTKYELSYLDKFFARFTTEGRITPDELIFFDKEFVSLYRTTLSGLFTNLRQVKRFLNSLYSSLPPIVDEVNLFDFVTLEVIKVFKVDIYNDIFEHWWYYVDQRHENDVLSRNFAWGFKNNSNDERRKIIRRHIDDLYAKLNLQSSDRDLWNEVLEKLFPNLVRESPISDGDRRQRRIYTSSFYKYFTTSVPIFELPDGYFVDTLKTWEHKKNVNIIIKTFDMVKRQGKLVEFLNKLRIVYLGDLSTKTIFNLIKAISKASINFSRKELGGMWDSEYDRGLFLLLRIFNTYIEKDRIQRTLESIINTTPDLLLAVDLVLTTKKERGGDSFTIYDNTDNMRLRKIAATRLNKRYLTSNNDLTKESLKGEGWVRILYQWGSNWGDKQSPNKDKVTDYIVNNVSKNVELFVKLIRSFGTAGFRGKWTMDIKEYEIAYDLRKLARLAEEILLKQKVSSDDSDILRLFLEAVESKQ